MIRFASWTLLLVCVPSAAPDTVLPGVEQYLDKDLRELDEKAETEFWSRFEAITGDRTEKEKDAWRVRPWWIRQFRAGEARWMFLEGRPGRSVPDMSAVRVHVFDAKWKCLFKQGFPTGYRLLLKEARIVTDKVPDQDLLVAKVVSTGPFIELNDGEKRPLFEHGDFQQEYYAMLGRALVLVRIEDDKGMIVPNAYRWSTPMKGPPVAERTKEMWLRGLRSGNTVEQLHVLVWLTGSHLDSRALRRDGFSEESIEDRQRFEAVRDAKETKSVIEGLIHSRVTWIREYAELARQVIGR